MDDEEDAFDPPEDAFDRAVQRQHRAQNKLAKWLFQRGVEHALRARVFTIDGHLSFYDEPAARLYHANQLERAFRNPRDEVQREGLRAMALWRLYQQLRDKPV